MNKIVLPSHLKPVSNAEVEARAPEFKLPPNPKSDKIHDIDTPPPEGLKKPSLWRILAYPVGQRRVSPGGIILTDETLDVNNWTHQLYKIAAIGQQVFRGPAFAGYDISEDEIPKVGELWLIDPKIPRRYTYDNYTICVLTDEQLIQRVDPETVPRFKFSDGMSL